MRYVTSPDRDKSGEWAKIKTEWGENWEGRSNDMLRDFASVLLGSNMVAVGATLDAKYFKSMPESPWKKTMRDPIFLGFFTLLMEALDKIDRINKQLSVAVIVDDDPEHAKDYYDLLAGLRAKFPRIRERISAITFGDDRAYPALQMADMLAFESRRLMVERMKNPGVKASDLYAAITSRGMHQPKLWTGDSLDKAAQIGISES